LRYLLDTNVISETHKKNPHPVVSRWLRQVPPGSLYMSVLTLGEMRKGVSGIGDGHRRARVLGFLDGQYQAWFGDRVLSVDSKVAEAWGDLEAKSNRTLPTIDALLAATAIAHGMMLVTRNTKDFKMIGLDVLDPWTDGGDTPVHPFMVNESGRAYRVPKKKGTKRAR
jgi:predicted nucleic acid-binding protein